MDKTTIEFLKTGRQLGIADGTLLDLLIGAEAECREAPQKPTEDPPVRKSGIAVRRDLDMYIRGMKEGARAAAYDILYVICGEVRQRDKRAWTFMLGRTPGLELVRTANGERHREPTPWGQSYVFQRVPLISNGAK